MIVYQSHLYPAYMFNALYHRIYIPIVLPFASYFIHDIHYDDGSPRCALCFLIGGTPWRAFLCLRETIGT